MTESLITVAVFVSPYEAGMAKSELEAFGIPAFVADEFTIGANPLYSNALGGIKVQVPASCAQNARNILSAQAPSDGLPEEKREHGNNLHKKMARSFVWLYLVLAAAMTAVAVYAFLKL
jgi:hypothetical protein